MKSLREQRQLAGIEPVRRSMFLSSGSLRVARPVAREVKGELRSGIEESEGARIAKLRKVLLRHVLLKLKKDFPKLDSDYIEWAVKARGNWSRKPKFLNPEQSAEVLEIKKRYKELFSREAKLAIMQELPDLEADDVRWAVSTKSPKSSEAIRKARALYKALVGKEAYAFIEQKTSGLAGQLELIEGKPLEARSSSRPISVSKYRDPLHDGLTEEEVKRQASIGFKVLKGTTRANPTEGLVEQRRLAGVSSNLPGLNKAKFKNAKILDKEHRGSEVHYTVLDPLDGTVKAQAVGTKIDVLGHVDNRTRFRVFSTIMRDMWGPAWNQLPKSVRTSLNNMLEKAGFDGNGRFISIGAAINKIHGVLNSQKIELSDVMSAHNFSGPRGTRNIDIEFHNNDDPFSPIPIANSSLSFSWHELAKNGPYEVVAYLG